MCTWSAMRCYGYGRRFHAPPPPWTVCIAFLSANVRLLIQCVFEVQPGLENKDALVPYCGVHHLEFAFLQHSQHCLFVFLLFISTF